VAYRVRLPPQLAAIHDIFHVSQLKNCIQVRTEIVEQQEILVQLDLSYIEYPDKILNTDSTKGDKNVQNPMESPYQG
jgi:hypothetical protein